LAGARGAPAACWWARAMVESADTVPEAFLITQIHTVSSHNLNQPAWAVHLVRVESAEAEDHLELGVAVALQRERRGPSCRQRLHVVATARRAEELGPG
jgi:hypothetical protein